MKADKHKDQKTKERQQVTRSAQNMMYLLPYEQENHAIFNKILLESTIDKIECIYGTVKIQGRDRNGHQTYHNMIRKNGVISYRSPYTNQYFPDIQQGIYPSPPARIIEEKGRQLFQQYAKLYYINNYITNFFVEESEEEFSFAFYIQKKYNDEDWQGVWNSTNIANITGDPSKSINYKVTSSVIYNITCKQENGETLNLRGNVKKSKNESKKISAGEQLDEVHLSMIGKMIEQCQTYLRQQIENIFVRKTKDIVDKIRIAETKTVHQERLANIKQILNSKQIKQ